MLRWIPCAFLLLVTQAMRVTEIIEDIKVDQRARQNRSAAFCSQVAQLRAKQNCCCESASSGKKLGNIGRLFGLCPAHYCSRAFTSPGETCEGTKYDWTCYRTKRILGQGTGCLAGKNGKPPDDPSLYECLEFYEDSNGEVHEGKDPEAEREAAENEARWAEIDRQEAEKQRAKFAEGSVIERYPAPMYGITPRAEEGVITMGCPSEGEICTIWYYTKGDFHEASSVVRVSHEAMEDGFMVGDRDYRTSDGLRNLGQYTELEYDDESLKAEIKQALTF